MVRSFHPHPIVAATKIILMEAALTVIIYLMRGFLERVLLTLLLALWFIGLAFILVAFLKSKFHTLTLDDNTITYNSGIVSLRRIVLPYAKITEASYTQDLVQRIFGVGSLNIDTAGGADIAIRIHDIRYEDLKNIIAEINKKGGRDSGT